LRTDFAQVCLDHTWHDLVAANDHGLRTRDLFYHQTKAADYLRILKDDPTLGIPPSREAVGDQGQGSGSGVRSQGSGVGSQRSAIRLYSEQR